MCGMRVIDSESAIGSEECTEIRTMGNGGRNQGINRKTGRKDGWMDGCVRVRVSILAGEHGQLYVHRCYSRGRSLGCIFYQSFGLIRCGSLKTASKSALCDPYRSYVAILVTVTHCRVPLLMMTRCFCRHKRRDRRFRGLSARRDSRTCHML